MALRDDYGLTRIYIENVDGVWAREPLRASPNDVRGRGIEAVFDDRDGVDASDMDVVFAWSHDQKKDLQGAEPMEAVEGLKSARRVFYPGPMQTVPGTVTASIIATKSAEKVFEIPLPTIIVPDRAVIDPSALPSDDTFSMFSEALVALKEGIADVTEYTEKANAAADAANEAASKAEGVVDAAESAASEAETAADAATEAATKASKAASDADAAASAATGAASKATEAATAAESATASANDAADSANAATTAANKATEEAEAAEAKRKDAEAAREKAEGERKAAEELRAKAEEKRAEKAAADEEAEAARVEAEKARVEAEKLRVAADGDRSTRQAANDTAQAKNNADQAANNKAAQGLVWVDLAEEQLDPETRIPNFVGEFGKLYFAPSQTPTESDVATEWMWKPTGDGGRWEHVGSSETVLPEAIGSEKVQQIHDGEQLSGNGIMYEADLAAYQALLNEDHTGHASAQRAIDDAQDAQITSAQASADAAGKAASAAEASAESAIADAKADLKAWVTDEAKAHGAKVADALGQASVGSTTNPIYLEAGAPKACNPYPDLGPYATKAYCDGAIDEAIGKAMEASY